MTDANFMRYVGQPQMECMVNIAEVLIDQLPNIDQDFLSTYLTAGYGVSYTPAELVGKFSQTEINLLNIKRENYLRMTLPKIMTEGIAKVYLHQLGYSELDIETAAGVSGQLFEEVIKTVVHGA